GDGGTDRLRHRDGAGSQDGAVRRRRTLLRPPARPRPRAAADDAVLASRRSYHRRRAPRRRFAPRRRIRRWTGRPRRHHRLDSRRRSVSGGMPAAIETRALRKVYPAPSAPKRRGPAMGPPMQSPVASAAPTDQARGEVVALEALDLDVTAGEFFGLLGPNGAGKTTTIGILTTRVLATAGTALVAGKSVATHAVQVRQR